MKEYINRELPGKDLDLWKEIQVEAVKHNQKVIEARQGQRASRAKFVRIVGHIIANNEREGK